jgi:antitoxin MazE
MRVTVKKRGNSASVRIPAAFMEAAQLQIDTVVDVSEENGRIIIEVVRDAELDLDQLIAGMTPDNLHEELILERLSARKPYDASVLCSGGRRYRLAGIFTASGT